VVTAHHARFVDGSGLLFDDELQLLAVLPVAANVDPEAVAREEYAEDGAFPGWHLQYPDSVAEVLAPLLASCNASPDEDASKTVSIEVTVCGDGFTVEATRTSVRSTCKRNELLPLVKTALLAEILAEEGVALHAAAVERAGRCLLLPGSPGSGKSTLCAALLRADDVLLLRGRTIRGLGLPLAVKEGGWAVLNALYPELLALPAHRRPDGLLVKYLTPCRVPAPDRISWIVFPHYEQGEPCRLEGIGRAAAFGRLVAEAHSPERRLHGGQFHALVRWMRGAQCFDLRYGHLEEAMSALETLTRPERLSDHAASASR
jgi:hypothetical protein